MCVCVVCGVCLCVISALWSVGVCSEVCVCVRYGLCRRCVCGELSGVGTAEDVCVACVCVEFCVCMRFMLCGVCE